MPEQTEDSYQTAPSLIRVCTVYYGVCIFLVILLLQGRSVLDLGRLQQYFWVSKIFGILRNLNT